MAITTLETFALAGGIKCPPASICVALWTVQGHFSGRTNATRILSQLALACYTHTRTSYSFENADGEC
jgi:hypothetical protein